MKVFKNFFNYLLIVLCIISISSCLDHNFDEPPVVVKELPFDANGTILNLKALYQAGKFVEITQDIKIHAIVIADDRSGNFYKTLVVQDSTAGIEIKLNATGLFAKFPEGMKIGIKCKGLTIGDYNGTIQLGKGTYLNGSNTNISGIEDAQVNSYLYAGPTGQYIKPRDLSIGALGAPYLSTLVRISGVEFSPADQGKTYADIVGKKSWNLTLNDCNKQSIFLRSSNFSTFGGQLVPSQNGSITAVFSVFGKDLQLFIRDTPDVKFTNPLCNGGGSSAVEKTIDDIRKLYSGATKIISDDYFIKAIVISDKDNKNVNGLNLVLQDASAGITARFTATHNFSIGDEVRINLKDVELSEFNGLLQLNKLDLAKASKISAGKTVVPKSISLSELNTNFENYESQLIKLSDVSLSKSSGTTYNGTCIVTQAGSTIDLFTAAAALFSASTIPTKNINLTCIVGQFTSKQVLMRSANDVEVIGGGGGGSTSVESFAVNFDGLLNNGTIAIAGWINEATIGTRVWLSKVFSGTVYAQATSFNDTNPEAEMWLISPKVNAAKAKILNFESAKSFWVHDGLRVMISSNFDGKNIKAATWQSLPCTLAKMSDADNTFVPSGDVDLSGYTTAYYIAFVYNGTSAANTSTFRVDNIVLKDK